MRNILIGLVIVSIVALGGLFYYFQGKEYVYTLTESQVYDKLSEKLPFSDSYLFVFNVQLDNPRVSLKSGTDRIGLGIDIGLNIKFVELEEPLTGSADVTTGISYNQDEAAFYLTDPQIDKLSLNGVPSEYTEKANDVVNSALLVYMKNNPVYSITASDRNALAAKMLLKEVKIQDAELVLTLGI